MLLWFFEKIFVSEDNIFHLCFNVITKKKKLCEDD